MSGSLRKKGNKYEFSYMYKGQRYFGGIRVDEVKSEKEAKDRLQEFCNDVRKGVYTNCNYTFYEFSTIWLAEVVKPNYAPHTIRSYVNCLNNRINPFLGSYKLKEITPLILTSWLNNLKSSYTIYNNREKKPLSKGTIEKNYNIVHAILTTAFSYELIPVNPCSRVKLKFKKDIKQSEEIHYYTPEQYHLLLNLLENEDIHKKTIIETAVKTGLRRSELFGLTWKDIDFNLNQLSVNKTRQLIKGEMRVLPCKTHSSVRTISIPKSLALVLQDYKEYTKGNEFVFQNINIDSITSWFRYWQEPNGLPRIKFHDLRHTHATLLLYAGVDIKTISKRLGHSTIQKTMDVYTHVIQELDANASTLIDTI